MKNIPDTRKQPTLFDFESAKLRLSMTLRRLVRADVPIVQASEFTLVDQVLTHALFAAGADIQLLVAKNVHPAKRSLRNITLERYDLQATTGATGDQDALEIASDDLGVSGETLSHWPVEALVQYVLDHEVPVDPADMPGFFKQAA